MTIAAREFSRAEAPASTKKDLPASREQRLIERRDALNSRIRWINRFRTLLLLVGAFFIITAGFSGFKAFSVSKEMRMLKSQYEEAQKTSGEEKAFVEAFNAYMQHDMQWDELVAQVVGAGAVGITLLLWCLALSSNSRQNELTDISNEIDLISIPTISYEQKAQKLLQMQQLELKRYYNQTLHQSAYIFWVGVADMLVGIAVVAFTIYLVHRIPAGEFEIWEKAIVGVVGAIGGILTNYVGVIYIKMFSEIIKGVTHSHDALVTMNHLHLANLFVADIDDKQLREKTLADLALALKVSLSRPAADAAALGPPAAAKSA